MYPGSAFPHLVVIMVAQRDPRAFRTCVDAGHILLEVELPLEVLRAHVRYPDRRHGPQIGITTHAEPQLRDIFRETNKTHIPNIWEPRILRDILGARCMSSGKESTANRREPLNQQYGLVLSSAAAHDLHRRSKHFQEFSCSAGLLPDRAMQQIPNSCALCLFAEPHVVGQFMVYAARLCRLARLLQAPYAVQAPKPT